MYQAAPVAPIYECMWHGSEDIDIQVGVGEFLMHTGVRYTFENITWLQYNDIRRMINGLWSDGAASGKADLFRQIKCLMPSTD